MTPATKRDVIRAREAGLLQTPLRRWRGKYEKWGAMRCCVLRCRNTSEFVTYLTDFPARIAYCAKHAEARR